MKRRLSAIAVVLALAPPALAQPAPDELAGARVVACSGDPAERPFLGDLLVEGDRIAGVFPGGAPDGVGPDSARVVDLAGATVMPGLCDAHTHISWPLDFVFNHPEIAAMADDEHALEVAGVVRTYLRWGYTTLVGAGALKPRVDVVVASAVDRGLIDGPRLWPSGSMITQRGAIGAGSCVEVDGADEMRRQVAEQVALGVRSVKLMVSGDGIVVEHPSQVTYMDDAMVAAAVDEATAGGAFVTAHARSTEGVRMAVRNGVRIVHHAPYLDDAAVAELTAARDDVWVCPGLHYLRAMVEGGAAPYGITREHVERALYPEELQASIDGLRKLHSNGVRIVAGGDFGHQWTKHGTYAAELAAYRDRGLFPHNHDFGDAWTPYFVDHRGVLCAVAHLLAIKAAFRKRRWRNDTTRTRQRAIRKIRQDAQEHAAAGDRVRHLDRGGPVRAAPRLPRDPPADLRTGPGPAGARERPAVHRQGHAFLLAPFGQPFVDVDASVAGLVDARALGAGKKLLLAPGVDRVGGDLGQLAHQRDRQPDRNSRHVQSEITLQGEPP